MHVIRTINITANQLPPPEVFTETSRTRMLLWYVATYTEAPLRALMEEVHDRPGVPHKAFCVSTGVEEQVGELRTPFPAV